jgi:hypothetical protein
LIGLVGVIRRWLAYLIDRCIEAHPRRTPSRVTPGR